MGANPACDLQADQDPDPGYTQAETFDLGSGNGLLLGWARPWTLERQVRLGIIFPQCY